MTEYDQYLANPMGAYNCACHDYDLARITNQNYDLARIVKEITEGKKVMNIVIGDHGYAPVREHQEDAGLDLRTPIGFVLEPHTSVTIDTKIHVQIPRGYAGLLVSKSGLNIKHGITSEGLIDPGYTGSICVKLYNNSNDEYAFHEGDKISQLVIVHTCTPDLVLIKQEDLEKSERGDSGFGSTGR